MDIQLVFNELCLLNLEDDEYKARELMSNFIQTLREALEQGIQQQLLSYNSFHNINLASNYSISKWLNDRNVDQVEQDFILSMQFFEFDEFDEFFDQSQSNEVLYACEDYNETPQGFIYACTHTSKVLSVSFKTHELWNNNVISVLQITNNEDGELLEEIIEVKHASSKNHVIEHEEWIKNRLYDNINSGLDLWNNRKEIFPHLEFCDSVEKQLENINNGYPIFQQIMKKLSELEEYSKKWISGTFNKDDFASKVTPESKSRLDNFEKELTFECLDGEKRLFSWHIRMTPGAWRLHFHPLKPTKIIIGYIGVKIQ
ncbi:hypothetical protein BMF77_00595 [Dolichospermum sp. UHCC 0315A]|uniref:hypothetical protein n=1 Tax=Dolichospermum sp. UHCC 0315A TaxID=1914871 RepID=UPI0011E6F877|nr:hypothetical protein [Dolichospermum sp. UHCC 0315A]QEI40038.1 hypothetical protein BMF77_00595 [Dolichospermum sp. UHCC 0315A]